MSTHTLPSLAVRTLLQEGLPAFRLAAGERALAGLAGAAKALALAALARSRRIVAVVPTDRHLADLVADTRLFLSVFDGLSAAEADRTVLPLPSQEVDPYRGLAPHFDVTAERAAALHAMARGQARVVVASVAALFPRVSPPGRLVQVAALLAPGTDQDPSDLVARLVDAGYVREDPVDQHGEFAVRGGVVDVFPAGDEHPVRLEFVGDTIESIRQYDPATQRSIRTLDRVLLPPLRDILDSAGGASDRAGSVVDYLRALGEATLVVSEPDDCRAEGRAFEERLGASYAEAGARGADGLLPPEALCLRWRDLEERLAGAFTLAELYVAAGDGDRPVRHVACQPVAPFRGRIGDWIADVRRAHERGDRVVAFMGTPGKVERTVELLNDYGVTAVAAEHAETTRTAVLVTPGSLSRGFRLADAALQLYAETDVFDEERHAPEKRRSLTRTFLSDFRDLKAGDHVVHVDHGIGMFVGLRQLAVESELHEFMELRYADDHKLFVPMDRLDLVQKYTGGARPTLDRLGGTTWEKAKSRVRKAMRDMAAELLRLYAARKALSGHAFGPDTHWQEEFEAAFEYELTPDQRTAIEDIKRDLEAPAPMDRLLCGDVGYGKTEVAMRAAFKVVMEGKQVALLAPTTVLALQHLKTFRNRFAAFPVQIEMVSRFRTRVEQKAVLADVAAGKVDVIIGTHRLLSKDVGFRELGLLIVDEEQRFGVAHKERIKQLRRRVDALAMTATPIPRTLNMSLVGIRDMSVIETPPRDRLSIQTNVVKFDQRVMVGAIRHELERAGQVYFVHNRVESIYSMGNLLTRLVPEARIGIGHGQMSENELEKVMVDFIERRYDVLLATTIIENGLDIPNANTIVINRADRYGLAQLYQLRGRVGRSDRRAYAYLLIPPVEALSPIARRRLAAIAEFSDLGSGFRIAALDLEIRGAGNLLGGEQSGHIEAVGFEMYMKLLEQTVRELKGEELEDDAHATVNLGIDLRIDDAYIPDMNQRLTVYRKIAAARSEAELDNVADEIRDRYGPLPASVLNLGEHARIRILADRLRAEGVDREGPSVVFKFRADSRVDAERFVAFVGRRPDLRLTSPVSVAMDLRVAPAAAGEGTRRRSGPGGADTSWWTARAATGRVEPGFSKELLARPRRDDPRAPGGVFERTVGLLRELTEAAGTAGPPA
jgi:transcription-repair coupling factor (superfamily II helicase)